MYICFSDGKWILFDILIMNISLDIVHGTAKYIRKKKQTDNFQSVELTSIYPVN